jgi:hypothetical protein
MIIITLGAGTMPTLAVGLLGRGLITMLAVWVCGCVAMRAREPIGLVGSRSHPTETHAPPPKPSERSQCHDRNQVRLTPYRSKISSIPVTAWGCGR